MKDKDNNSNFKKHLEIHYINQNATENIYNTETKYESDISFAQIWTSCSKAN